MMHCPTNVKNKPAPKILNTI